MKSIFYIALLNFVLFSCVQAQEPFSQIIITKTSKKSNLRIIKQKLDRLKVKMYVQKKGAYFFIYSQKFTNDTNANQTLQKIKRYFRYAKLLEHTTKTIEKKKTESTAIIVKKKEEDKYFVNLAFGMQNISGDTTESGLSYMLEGGYIYDEDFFVTLTYLNSSSSTLSLSNIYTSLNYVLYTTPSTQLYSGAILGYSQLEKNGYSPSTSLAFGAQIGYKYALYDSFDIYTAYQAVLTDHIINITNTKVMKFNLLHNLQLGISYKF